MGGMDLGGNGGFTPEYGLEAFQKQRKDVVRGIVSFDITQQITEYPKSTLSNGDVNLEVKAELHVPGMTDYYFTQNDTLVADKSVIANVSASSYPRSSSKLTSKIIDQFIEEETDNLASLKENRTERIVQFDTNRTKFSAGLGFISGTSLATTIFLASEGDSWSFVTGWVGVVTSTVLIMGLRDQGFTARRVTEKLDDKNIDLATRRISVLKLIEFASRKQSVEDRE